MGLPDSLAKPPRRQGKATPCSPCVLLPRCAVSMQDSGANLTLDTRCSSKRHLDRARRRCCIPWRLGGLAREFQRRENWLRRHSAKPPDAGRAFPMDLPPGDGVHCVFDPAAVLKALEWYREAFGTPIGLTEHHALCRFDARVQLGEACYLRATGAFVIGGKAGAPCRTRTCDPRLRRPMLYPAELRAR